MQTIQHTVRLLVLAVAFYGSITTTAQTMNSIQASSPAKAPFEKPFRLGGSFNLYWTTFKGGNLPADYFAKPSLGMNLRAELLAADWQGLLDDDDRRVLESWGRRLAATAAGAPGPVCAPEGPAPAMPAASAVARGAPAAGLNSREVEVLERIAAGDSNKLIARVFDLSPHTVKRHVANILDKLEAQSRGQAAAWYREHA